MKARFINEEDNSFKRKKDPYKALRVGMLKWEDVTDGFILLSKMPFSVHAITNKLSPEYVISRGGTQPANTYFVCDNVTRRYPGTMREIINFHAIPCRDIESARKAREKVLEGNYFPSEGFMVWDEIDHISYYFDIVQRSQLKESMIFNREETDIYKKLNIGIKTWDTIKKGNILKAKDALELSLTGKFLSKGSNSSRRTIWKESYILITAITKRENSHLEIEYVQCWDLAEALRRVKTLLSGHALATASYPMVGSYLQFERRFEIMQDRDITVS